MDQQEINDIEKPSNIYSAIQKIENKDLETIRYVKSAIKKKYAKPVKYLIELDKIAKNVSMCGASSTLQVMHDSDLLDFIEKHHLEEYLPNIKYVQLDSTNRKVERIHKKLK